MGLKNIKGITLERTSKEDAKKAEADVSEESHLLIDL